MDRLQLASTYLAELRKWLTSIDRVPDFIIEIMNFLDASEIHLAGGGVGNGPCSE